MCMYVDPVVEEMRRNFDEIARRFDYDIHRIAEYFREHQAEHADRLVSHPRGSKRHDEQSPPDSP